MRGKPVFDKDAPSEVEFLSYERDLIARAAGSAVKIASARPENAGTAATPTSDGPQVPPRRRWGLYGAGTAACPGGGVTADT